MIFSHLISDFLGSWYDKWLCIEMWTFGVCGMRHLGWEQETLTIVCHVALLTLCVWVVASLPLEG
jgi:hypothetical protein